MAVGRSARLLSDGEPGRLPLHRPGDNRSRTSRRLPRHGSNHSPNSPFRPGSPANRSPAPIRPRKLQALGGRLAPTRPRHGLHSTRGSLSSFSALPLSELSICGRKECDGAASRNTHEISPENNKEQQGLAQDRPRGGNPRAENPNAPKRGAYGPSTGVRDGAR